MFDSKFDDILSEITDFDRFDEVMRIVYSEENDTNESQSETNAHDDLLDLTKRAGKIDRIKRYFNAIKINEEDYTTALEHLREFLDSYSYQKKPIICYPSDDGKPREFSSTANNDSKLYPDDLLKIYNRDRLPGSSFQGSYLGTDGSKYIGKKSWSSTLDYIGEAADYNPIMASSFFAYFEEPVAEYSLVHVQGEENWIITKSFLSNGQKLYGFNRLKCLNPSDFESNNNSEDSKTSSNIILTHSQLLFLLKKNIYARLYTVLPERQLINLNDTLCLQYCKQHFFKQLIGPTDPNPSNTSLMITSSRKGTSYSISPAYDLEPSFNDSVEMQIVELMNEVTQPNNSLLFMIRDDKGQHYTLSSLVEEFMKFPDFSEFYEDFVMRLQFDGVEQIANEIIDAAITKTNFNYFREHRQDYFDFLCERFRETIEVYKDIWLSGQSIYEEGFEL